MATLIPEVSLTDFRHLKVWQLKQLKSCEVFADGQYLFTFIRPQTDYIRVQSENTAQLGNGVGGKDLVDIKEVING